MFEDLRTNLKENSIWHIAQLKDIHAQLPFHIVETGRFFAQENGYVRRSGRNDFLFIYTLGGEAELCYRERRMHLTEGTVALIDCREYHEYRPCQPFLRDWEFYFMHISGQSCQIYFDALFKDDYSVLFVGEDKTFFVQFEKIFKIFEKPGFDVCFYLSDCVSRMMTQLIDCKQSRIHSTDKHEEILQASIDYIKENYGLPMTVEQIADQVQFSKNYFIKLFKEHMHITPYEYLVRHRINEAKKLLLSTGCTALKISELVGFQDECNFNRTFKKITGFTPLQYRDRF